MNPLATRMAFGKRIMELGKINENFVVCSADTKACGIETFGTIYPGREFCFGIAEQNLMGGAVGLASCGNKVLVATFAVFVTMRACEQVRTFIAHTDSNIALIGTHTGLQVGSDGATHAAVEDVGIMRSIPNITIVQPSDAISAYSLADIVLEYAHPMYVRLHRNPSPDIHDKNFQFELGKVYELRNYGKDAAIITSGLMTVKALEAAEKLRNENIYIKVLEVPTIKPLNTAPIIATAQETKAVLTIEDHNIYNGLGSAVAETLSQECPTRMKILGIQDKFSESGNPELLYKDNHMTVEDIIVNIKMLINAKTN